MKCPRCYNTKFFLFRKIYCDSCDKCYYCLKCAHISIFKLCDKLDVDIVFTYDKLRYKLKYQLTNKQQHLSTKICREIVYKHLFINATCGAGKTEIVFEIIERYINNGKHVCFVCPRAEVIHELYYRFNNAFNTTFAIKTGKYKILEGAMCFMTCHQLVNYHDIFDLVIVDEADAFPLYGDSVLEGSITRSLRDGGRIIKMSATPIKINTEYMELRLSERYHQARIPVPYFIKRDDSKLLETISSGKWIVFFPTIKCLEEFRSNHEYDEVIICHSKIDYVIDRIDIENENYVIFSTAILERGITFSNVNVVVYEASHSNYTLHTLVQIAGRVGRVFPYVEGEVIFMGEIENRSIRKCIKYLEGLND